MGNCQNKVHLGWAGFRADVIALAKQLPQDAVIWGIPRGGVFVAEMIGHERDDITVLHNDAMPEHTDAACSISDPKGFREARPLFIVDEICDTGTMLETAQSVAEHRQQCVRTAVVYLRHTSRVKPDLYQVELRRDDWLVFPYEKEWRGA